FGYGGTIQPTGDFTPKATDAMDESMVAGLRLGVQGFVLAAVATSSLAAVDARAHGLAPVLLEVAARTDGTASVSWKTAPSLPRGTNLAPELPPACRPRGDVVEGTTPEGVTRTWEVDCGPAGLVGETISVRDLDLARTDALLRVSLPDGRELRTVLRGDRPAFVVPGPTSEAEAFRDGLRRGVAHLRDRADALLFVAALVLLARDARSLALAVAAFLVANSATLVASALGAIEPRPALAGFLAAASVVAIAAEVARDETDTTASEHPWIPATVLGAVLGLALAPLALGFAPGSVADTPAGIVSEARGPAALLGWHLGVEAILAVAAGAAGAAWLATVAALRRGRGLGSLPGVARAIAWPIGCVAAFLAIERASRLAG
ncbi:MAG: HupE/UreJ family protein, partial [Alphaproteobacteria bacterium]